MRKYVYNFSMDAPELFPMRELVKRTGVNASTLRAWENRHGLIVPSRAPSGHRLYSEADARRVRRIREMLEQGLALGEIGGKLAGAAVPTTPSTPAQVPGGGHDWRAYIAETLRALEDFSTERLDALYNEACAIYAIDMLTRNLLLPVLEHLGDQWDKRPSGIAEEHFFSAWLRNKLGARLHHASGLPRGKPLLLACLPGESHEIGLLLFALATLARGYRVVYLGASLPIRQIVHVVARGHVAAVVLAGRAVRRPHALLADLGWLADHCAAPVCVGSHFSAAERDALQEAGIFPLGSDLILGLDRLEEILARARRRPDAR
jgi:DNA-binding transcriptional MerR regulator